MFTDHTNNLDSVNINPSWKQKRELNQNGMQTEETSKSDQETQNPIAINISTQTEEAKLSIQHTADYNAFTLLAFLQKWEPRIVAQLKQNAASKAFEYYQPLGIGDNAETEKLVEFQYEPWKGELEVSSLSWNCTGSVLAVAYGNHLHDSWCQHDAGCILWNVSRAKGNTPQNIIETDCCLTTLAFHPKLPSLLAVGKFNGILSIYNTSGDEDDPNLASSEDAGQDGHKEPITGLNWIPHSKTPNKMMLVSSSLDGKILFWKVSDDFTKIDIEDGFLLISKHLPRSLIVKNLEAEVGVTCISFNPEDPTIFIIGTEGGVVCQCSMNSRLETNRVLSNGIRLKSPIGMSFNPHNGYIEAIDFSPHTRNVFCSCSSDGELRIYTLLQPEPLVSMQSSSGLKRALWSPVCPLLIGAVASSGQLQIYDLYMNPNSPLSFEAPLGSEGAAFAFNNKNYQLISTSSVKGRIQVWRLGSSYQATRSNEIAKLLSFGSVKKQY